MRITLISKKQYLLLKRIQQKFPVLTFNNRGYEYIRTPFNEREQQAFDKVSSILSEHIDGFVKFNNFRDQGGYIVLRFQYNYNYETSNASFTGVGYIKLKELLEGFETKNKGNEIYCI